MGKIREKEITFYDIIGGMNVDPDPRSVAKTFEERVRCSRFTTDNANTRLCEILTDGQYDPDRPYQNLGIPLKDLVRFWWNNVADQEDMLFEIFDGIMTYYSAKLFPKEQEEVQPDYADAFDKVLV
jgi:hypothetical protein